MIIFYVATHCEYCKVAKARLAYYIPFMQIHDVHKDGWPDDPAVVTPELVAYNEDGTIKERLAGLVPNKQYLDFFKRNLDEAKAVYKKSIGKA